MHPSQLPSEIWVMVAEELPPEYYCKLHQFAKKNGLARLDFLEKAIETAMIKHLECWNTHDESDAIPEDLDGPGTARGPYTQAQENTYLAHHLHRKWIEPVISTEGFSDRLAFKGRYLAHVSVGNVVEVHDLVNGETSTIRNTYQHILRTSAVWLTEDLVGVVSNKHFAVSRLDQMNFSSEGSGKIYCPGDFAGEVKAITGMKTIVVMLLQVAPNTLHLSRFHYKSEPSNYMLATSVSDSRARYRLLMDGDYVYVIIGYQATSDSTEIKFDMEVFNNDGALREPVTIHKAFVERFQQMRIFPTGVKHRFLMTFGSTVLSHTILFELSQFAITGHVATERVGDNCAVWKDRMYLTSRRGFKSMSLAEQRAQGKMATCSGESPLIVNESFALRLSDDDPMYTGTRYEGFPLYVARHRARGLEPLRVYDMSELSSK